MVVDNVTIETKKIPRATSKSVHLWKMRTSGLNFSQSRGGPELDIHVVKQWINIHLYD